MIILRSGLLYPTVKNLLPPMTSSNWTLSGLTFYQDNPYGWDGWIEGYPGVECITQSSRAEGYYQTKQKIPLIKGHTYYVRWTTIAATSSYSRISFDCYWPLEEPPMASGISCKNDNYYQMNAAVIARNNWSSGNYNLRFDINNDSIVFHANMSNPMLIDLTEAYGTSMPTLANLNKRIYFEDEIPISDWINHP